MVSNGSAIGWGGRLAQPALSRIQIALECEPIQLAT